LKLLYPFPEPLPLDRARGIQVVHAVSAIADLGIPIVLAHVPASGHDPFAAYRVRKPGDVALLPLSYALPWPLARLHSNRVFHARMERAVDWREIGAVLTRHLKSACYAHAHRQRVPMVYEAHEVFADTAAPRRRSRVAALERAAVESATALVANSNATARRLAALYRVRAEIVVAPNGVDYPASIPEKEWTRSRERVIYSGSFFGWKGVEDLVAAARSLPGFCIRLLGGDEAGVARLRALSAPEGAQLDFAGRVPHAQVADELQRACIAVLPNRADPDSAFTSPIKLFEYMAAGCALVASDLPPIREILAEDEAMWVAPGDARAIAEAIRALADDPARARRMGERLREKAKRYTWAARGERIARVLRPLLRRT
jgi:glycosyltransferase involved in cell wall biosynthesis